jgi:hypothetical protein
MATSIKHNMEQVRGHNMKESFCKTMGIKQLSKYGWGLAQKLQTSGHI